MDYMMNNIFDILMTILGTLIALYFKDIIKKLDILTTSINLLNIKMAEIIKESSYRKEETMEIKSRLARLESVIHKE